MTVVRSKRKLRTEDFAGDGKPYTEILVKISIRILGKAITRSRLAVSVYPDPALEDLARKSLVALEKESFGYNEDGVFGASLSENFNGWEDLEKDYPRIDENTKSRHERECLGSMNAYLKESVEWALEINKKGMEIAAANGPQASNKPRVM